MNNFLEVPASFQFNSPVGIDPCESERQILKSDRLGHVPKVQIGIPRFSEFLLQVLEQTRRISPSFKLKSHDGSILDQVAGMFKDCVELYLKRYTKQLVFHQKHKSTGEDLTEFEGEEERARETMRNLLKYEQLLNKKEQAIQLKSQKLEEDLQNFQIIKVNFEGYIESFECEKNSWLETKNKEIEKIESDKKKIAHDKADIEKILGNLKVYKENWDKKQEQAVESVKKREELLRETEDSLEKLKESLMLEKAQFQSQKIQFDNEKWAFESKLESLEDKEAIYALKIEHLESEKTELLKEKEAFLEEKSKFEREKHEVHSNLGRNCEKFVLSDCQVESVTGSSSPYFGIPFSEPSKEIEQVYFELNHELERVYRDIQERESGLAKREAELEYKVNEYKSIEYSLFESKIQLEEFQLYTIPEIEDNTQQIQSLIESLQRLKYELESLVGKVTKELAQIKRFSLNLEVIHEETYESTPEASPKIELKRGFIDIEDFSSKLKEIEKISENISKRMNTSETTESDLEKSIEEKLKEISQMYENKSICE